MRARMEKMGIVFMMLQPELSPKAKQGMDHDSLGSAEDLHATTIVWE